MTSLEKKLKYFLKKNLSNKNLVIHSDFLKLNRKLLLNQRKLKLIFSIHFNKSIFLPAFNLTKKKKLNFDKHESSLVL
jgi:hypothetical protein